jgi:hypothetical protein
MRKLVLVAAAIGTLGTLSLSAEAMPISGAAAPSVSVNPAIQKAEVVVVRRRPAVVVRRRPAVVVRRRPAIIVR